MGGGVGGLVGMVEGGGWRVRGEWIGMNGRMSV